VFKQAFSYIIADFAAYKPILSSVKQEYENYIATLQEKALLVQSLQTKLNVVASESITWTYIDLY
jgi:hypothetical protein